MPWSRWWRRRAGGSGRGGGAREVVIWSREGCHLCEDMVELVRAVADEPGRRSVQVRVRDLDVEAADDPTLHARYNALLPVLLVDGAEIAHWQVDPDTLRAAFDGA